MCTRTRTRYVRVQWGKTPKDGKNTFLSEESFFRCFSCIFGGGGIDPHSYLIMLFNEIIPLVFNTILKHSHFKK